jgi:hypothetical protein
MTGSTSHRVPYGYSDREMWHRVGTLVQQLWLAKMSIAKTTALDDVVQERVSKDKLPTSMQWPDGTTEARGIDQIVVTLPGNRRLNFGLLTEDDVLASKARITWKRYLLVSGEIWVVPSFETNDGPRFITQDEASNDVGTKFVGVIKLAQLVPNATIELVCGTENIEAFRKFGTPREAKKKQQAIAFTIGATHAKR